MRLIFSRHLRPSDLMKEKKIYTSNTKTQNKFKVILLDFLFSFQLYLADFLQLMTAQSQKPLFKLILAGVLPNATESSRKII